VADGAGDDAVARRLLAAAVPAHVREVCATIAAAGHEAVTVGGAVRDALLGRHPGDWDVATSARPDEVIALFRHTVPTGIEHGTITVVTGKSAAAQSKTDHHVEVTTFRGEGAYTDARRPDHVVFGVPLIEDLARRDLVVNAMAYDPGRDVLHDPFGGRVDLEHKRLRAVGDAVARFTEDGLRVMRAMRFAAQLEFELDPDTEAAIAPALPSLAKVSRERVCVELRKTLATREPSRGFAIAQRTGIIATVLPVLAPRIDDAWLGRIDRAPVAVRLAAMLVPLAELGVAGHVDRAVHKRVLDVLHALTFSNDESKLAAALVAVAHADAEPVWTPPEVRRLLAQIEAPRRAQAIELWAAAPAPNAALIAEARRVLAAREPLAAGDLAITGKDVMSVLAMRPGPAIGRLLVQLVEHVLDDPARNTREALLAYAQQCELELGHD
jgi:tRNA nucleotidyltransferase (CCA-adding enzyme)